MRSSSWLRKFAAGSILVFISTFGFAVQKQLQPVNDPERQEALRLYSEHKMPEAATLLEKVVAKYPDDAVALEALGASLLNRADTQPDAEKKKADRLKARAALLHAKELGDNSDLCRTLLASIPEDGSQAAFSNNNDVQAAMHRGEAAFAKGDYDQAIQEYSAALAMDPKLYPAALYIGDMYFRQKKTDEAGKWFARAIQIEPDQESAYRYWGDALLQAGRMKEAREKYIQGLIAYPYLQTSWNGLNQWVQGNHLHYKQLSIKLPKAPTDDGKGHTNITIDPTTLDKKDGGAAWLSYSLERALWRGEKFSQEYPQEKTYRHSLKEEVAALSMTASVFDETKKKDKVKDADPSLVLLSQLKAEGMLEPYVLLVIPDKEIVKDYPAYRAANSDKMIAFVDKYIVHPAPE